MPRLDLQLTLPNQLTLLRILLTPLFAYLLLSDHPVARQASLVVFVVAALTDWYDGWAARKFESISRWGKFLDPLADKILSSAALLAYVSLDLVDAWMVWIVIIRDFAITGLRSYAEYLDRPIVTSKSAQAKTFGQFIVIYYILILYVARSIPPVYREFGEAIDALMNPDVLFGMMLVVTISTVGTAVLYLIDNRSFLREIWSGNVDQQA
ncbi:MAG: CDP-diacylglycerol--glycerol-3-phosphate 3-phosphatidyltransferase [Ignavibacteria bacterium]|nr:CDP-diacylglycerol--glycerol-3-phosphate 3-phosphatidyltransferase [Ignavibacteria bacterium]